MKMMLVGLSFLGMSCAHTHASSTSDPQRDPLDDLRLAIASPVASAEQNARNSELVEQISEDGNLQGLTRDEVAHKIGKGDVCSRHVLCGQQGFAEDDWYFEVGQMGGEYVRTRPVLIVGFDRFGKAVRTFNMRVE